MGLHAENGKFGEYFHTKRRNMLYMTAFSAGSS
jgi:hypothetical protein